LKHGQKKYHDLPYYPGGDLLSYKTIDADAIHYGGLEEYDVHNYFGFLESKATFDYLKDKAGHGLPFILSRSTVPGSGKHVAHWGGDNKST